MKLIKCFVILSLFITSCSILNWNQKSSVSLAPIYDRNSELVGFIDETGEVVINFQYIYAFEFSSNRALVLSQDYWWLLINAKNEITDSIGRNDSFPMYRSKYQIEFQYNQRKLVDSIIPLMKESNGLGYNVYYHLGGYFLNDKRYKFAGNFNAQFAPVVAHQTTYEVYYGTIDKSGIEHWLDFERVKNPSSLVFTEFCDSMTLAFNLLELEPAYYEIFVFNVKGETQDLQLNSTFFFDNETPQFLVHSKSGYKLFASKFDPCSEPDSNTLLPVISCSFEDPILINMKETLEIRNKHWIVLGNFNEVYI